MKVCFISSAPPKPNCMTSAIYLNESMSKKAETTILKWNYYNRISTTLAPILRFSDLRKALKENDVVHVQYDLAGYMPLFLPLLILARYHTKASLVITSHEKFDNVPLPWFVKQWHNFCYLGLDQIFVHTEDHKNTIPHFHRHKVKVIPHGVIQRSNVQKKHFGHKILLAGFINRWKGHDVVIRSMPEILKKFPDTKLYIVGKAHDVKYYEELQKIVETENISKNVIFKTGYIPEKDFLKYFEKTDLAILPYSRITMSGILCHLASYNVPTIMSDIGPFKEVTHNKLEYFNPDSSEELANKTIKLFSNQKKMIALGNEMRKLSKEYSWDKMAEKTLNSYKIRDEEIRIRQFIKFTMLYCGLLISWMIASVFMFFLEKDSLMDNPYYEEESEK